MFSHTLACYLCCFLGSMITWLLRGGVSVLQLAIPLNFIGTAYRELTLNTIDLEKLQQLLQLRPLVQDPPNPVAFHLRGGAVEFRDVKFAYPPSHSLDQSSVHPSPQNQESCKMHQTSTGVHGGGKLVLDGFSLQVPAGSRVALVGESGSGKTTLIRLLYRLADPISGVVSIDGQDLKTLPIMSFRYLAVGGAIDAVLTN